MKSCKPEFASKFISETLKSKEVSMIEGVLREFDAKIRAKLKELGVDMPENIPLGKIRTYCGNGEKCHDVCYGPYGLSSMLGINMRLVCGKKDQTAGPNNGLAKASRKLQTGRAAGLLGSSLENNMTEGIAS